MARLRGLGLLATGILIAGCIAPTGASEMATPVFAVSAEGDGNEIKVNVEDGTAIADVRSQRGIGSATEAEGQPLIDAVEAVLAALSA